MSVLLSRSALGEITARLLEDGKVGTREAILDCDAALRAIIQRAVEDVEKMPHFGICHARDMSACHNGADRECEWMVARCRTHKPEAFICNCGHDSTIARLKEGLGEK